jgi:hypothetical protein
MTRLSFAIVFLIILALSLSLGLAAEDVPETAYDESVALPYEGVPLFSVVRPMAARTTQDVPNSLRLEPGALFLFAAARIYDAGANRSTDAGVSLARICTLLC